MPDIKKLIFNAFTIRDVVKLAAEKHFPGEGKYAATTLSMQSLGRIRYTFGHLIELSNEGVLRTTQATLAEACNKSARALRNDFRDLESLGLLETKMIYSEEEKRVTNTYTTPAQVWEALKEDAIYE